MNVCLLCLESKKEIAECIKVNSDKWNQQNLHELIEKHLWPMEAINPSSWMCIKCGEVLYDFHIFYKRIEDAHKQFDTLFKHENEMSILDEKDLYDTESIKSKDDFKDNVFDEDDLEENISAEPPVINELMLDDPFVKIEKREGLNTKNRDYPKHRKKDRSKKILLNREEKNDLHHTDVSKSKDDFKDDVLDENALEENISVEPPVNNELVLDDPFVKIERREDLNTENGESCKNRKRGRPKKITVNNEEEEKEDLLPKKIRHSKRSKQKLKGNDLSESIEEKNSKLKGDNDQNLRNENISNDSETDLENISETIDLKKKKNHRNLDKEILKEYDRIIAENFKIFCNICQMALDNFVSLRKHCKVEHKTRGYARCCKRNFYTRSLLVDHINVHLNREYFKCQQCGKVFSDRSRLQCHKKFHDDSSSLDKCEQCGKLFADKGAFKKHKLTHSSEKSYPCNVCGRCFSSNFILNHHIEAIHENKYVQICEICGKSIRCPTAFARHMETHDTNTLPVSCDVCGLILSNKEGLKRHKYSQHPEGGKKEHACHICLKISPTERALKAHIRSVHEQGLDLKCSLCEKSFKRPGALKEHLATHTGRPLYTCLWCPRTFISNGNMYNHRKNAHPKEWEELKRQKYIGNKL